VSHKTDTVGTLLLVWDGFGFDDANVMRDDIAALISAAYDAARIEALSPSRNEPVKQKGDLFFAEKGPTFIANAETTRQGDPSPEASRPTPNAHIDLERQMNTPPGHFVSPQKA
jgi:hypothetical protein